MFVKRGGENMSAPIPWSFLYRRIVIFNIELFVSHFYLKRIIGQVKFCPYCETALAA